MMGGQELGQDFAVPQLQPGQLRAAAINVADRIAAEHPHPLDDVLPRLAGRQLGQDPVIAAGVLELLDTLGLHTNTARLTTNTTQGETA
ncbi:hypothetical protein [Streptomyces sp. NPDC004230]